MKPPRQEYRVELKLRYGSPQEEKAIKDFLWELLKEYCDPSRTDGGLIGAFTLSVAERLKADAVEAVTEDNT